MNQVVFFMSDGCWLGRTFECCGDDEVRLAVNLICQDMSRDQLTDKEFASFLDDQSFHCERAKGCIYMGGIEAIS